MYNKKIIIYIIALFFCSLLNLSAFAAEKPNAATNKAATAKNTTTVKKTSGFDYYPKYPKPDLTKGNPALIKKGEYLARAGDCIACHTNTNKPGSKSFAGGLAINTPFGVFYTPNITPDKKTGIGNWTVKQFVRAMHEGINPKGQYYFPVFPYPSFTKVSKQDLIAIKAYLDAIPPVNQKNKPPGAPWPFSWRFAQLGWRLMFFKPDYYKYDPKHSAQWNRGAYLVQGLGHCGACHTPRNFLGASKNKYYLNGGFIDGFWAPNITSLEFKDIPQSEIVNVFTHDELLNQAGPVARPMKEVDHDSLQYMSSYDLNAIAMYLKSVKSQKATMQVTTEDKENYATGEKIYNNVCSVCHTAGVAGAPKIYDAYEWQMRLKNQGLDTLYVHAIKGYNSMPQKGGCLDCSDTEIKAAVDYILANSRDVSEMQNIRRAETKPVDTSIEHGQKIYAQACSQCHDDGRLGAPKLGDQKVWQQLAKKNIDILYRNTLLGKHHAPYRGGCKQCTNADILAAVKYMVKQGDPQGNYSGW
ncbi:MAG: c-type cytochrome [Pseudomonadota bacterium]